MAKRWRFPGIAPYPSMRVAFVRVPGRLLWIVRTIIDFNNNGFLVRDRGAVDVALRVAIKSSGRDHDFGRGIFVFPFQAEH